MRWKRLTVDHSSSSRSGFEPSVAQRRDEGVEDVGERALDPMFTRQGTGVRLVPMGAIAEQLQRVDAAGGG